MHNLSNLQLINLNITVIANIFVTKYQLIKIFEYICILMIEDRRTIANLFPPFNKTLLMSPFFDQFQIRTIVTQTKKLQMSFSGKIFRNVIFEYFRDVSADMLASCLQMN